MHRFHYERTLSYSRADRSHQVEEYRHELTGLQFVLLPEGGPVGPPIPGRDERVLITSTIRPFLICKTEVPQKVWRDIMGANPSGNIGDDLPVDSVTWYEAKAFCIKTGLALPYEVEWEYALRAGTETLFYWGDEMDLDHGWLRENAAGITRPVGTRLPNPFGLHDMVGNVYEWCESWYHDSGMSYFPDRDRLRKGEKALRVLRGGSASNSTFWARSSIRTGYGPHGSMAYFGFRPIRRMDESILLRREGGK